MNIKVINHCVDDLEKRLQSIDSFRLKASEVEIDFRTLRQEKFSKKTSDHIDLLEYLIISNIKDEMETVMKSFKKIQDDEIHYPKENWTEEEQTRINILQQDIKDARDYFG